jgi:hypothetical protein
MSGMNPNNAIIALLQMRSDKLVSRDYVRREIPMELNVTQEEQRVDIEEMRDSLRVAVAQYAQAIPALAAQGQDPSQIVSRIAEVIKGRQKGLATRNYCGEGIYTRATTRNANGRTSSSSRYGPRSCLAANSRTNGCGPCCWRSSRHCYVTRIYCRVGRCNMKKGGRAKAPMQQPTKGKMDTKKPTKSRC